MPHPPASSIPLHSPDGSDPSARRSRPCFLNHGRHLRSILCCDAEGNPPRPGHGCNVPRIHPASSRVFRRPSSLFLFLSSFRILISSVERNAGEAADVPWTGVPADRGYRFRTALVPRHDHHLYYYSEPDRWDGCVKFGDQNFAPPDVIRRLWNGGCFRWSLDECDPPFHRRRV